MTALTKDELHDLRTAISDSMTATGHELLSAGTDFAGHREKISLSFRRNDLTTTVTIDMVSIPG